MHIPSILRNSVNKESHFIELSEVMTLVMLEECSSISMLHSLKQCMLNVRPKDCIIKSDIVAVAVEGLIVSFPSISLVFFFCK